MPCSRTPGSIEVLALTRFSILTSAGSTASSFPMKTFEAQSLQLTLTAYCLDCPVLNLWNYSRRPRVLYPAAGLPYWSGIHTRWNIRPCLAALTPVILQLCRNLGIYTKRDVLGTGIAATRQHGDCLGVQTFGRAEQPAPLWAAYWVKLVEMRLV